MTPTTPNPDELQKILLDRLNLSDKEKKEFIFPEYKIGDLSLFEDMNIAVDRLYQAIKNGEQIGIYSDYDCDGIPGAVVLIDFFKAIKYIENVHVYIPDRHDEGYGLSKLGIDELEKKDVSLIITVDLGITAISEVADARSRNIDVIVTDHHEPLSPPAGGLPAALAVVHPKKGTYPNQDPCGATMAFYLVCAFLEKHKDEFGIKEGWEKWLLDMVGFATLSDMVPLVGENRMLASYGMMVMKKTRRIGLRTLFGEQRMNIERLTETDLTFTVAPRLNAASRMSSPMLAFALLSTEDQREALVIAKELEKINNERKTLVARIVKESHKKLDARDLPEIVVLGDLSWRPAVLGLVANKLQETYNRSFFVWGESGDGFIKGSCRMLDEHHAAYIFQALPEGVLLHAGGHQAAGGFAVAKEKIHFLEEELNKAVKNVNHTAEEKGNTDAISTNLSVATTRHLEKLRTLAPFGVGNPEPLFLFENVKVFITKMFGKNKEHLECNLEDSFGKATAFNFFTDPDMKEKIFAGASISFVGTLEAGWRGGVRIRIQALV
ncbi:single-stranded-DNA-specific exonuclease RecJ [Candidatus Nomurabacteria bacterium]|nr:single-stranded-DNA-specific exonuclease RecJ [Candidatus Nomurabacteria bacterium]